MCIHDCACWAVHKKVKGCSLNMAALNYINNSPVAQCKILFTKSLYIHFKNLSFLTKVKLLFNF